MNPPSQATPKRLRPRRQPHPKPTPRAAAEVTRALQLLRSTIHGRGFKQLQIQESFGWGRTYVSQLLRQQKSLRLDQLLQILHFVGRDPADFFVELYGGVPPRSIDEHVRGELELLLQRVFFGFFATHENEKARAPGPNHARGLARAFLTHLEQSAMDPMAVPRPEGDR